MTTPPPPPHGIQRTPIKYVVFAGNFREFRVWMLSTGVREDESMFVADRQNLRALQNLNLTFVMIGTFHLRKDARDIMEYARSIWPNAPEFQATF